MTIDVSDLTIALEEGERWRRTLSVTVPAAVVSSERGRVAKKLAKRLKLPGFRKGRIPSGVVEQRYGAALDKEVLDQVIGDAFREALARNELAPISEGEVEKLQYEPDQDLHFSIAFDVQPEIELGRLGGFKVERPKVEVSEEQVEQVLERLREQNGSWEVVEGGRPASGELVSVTLTKVEEGEDSEPRQYEFVLGQGDAIPDVEEAIITLEVGSSGTFVVRFPDDFPNEERRGQEEQLTIQLLARHIRTLPELTDEFASSMGDFESVADLRSKVAEDLAKEASDQAEGMVRGRLLDQVLDANPFTIPVSMVDRYLESVLGGARDASDEELAEARERLLPDAERAVKRILVVERIAESQALRATEEEIDDRVEGIAERTGESPAQVYAKLQKAERLESLEREITERKVFDFLKGESEVKES